MDIRPLFFTLIQRQKISLQSPTLSDKNMLFLNSIRTISFKD